MARDEGWLAEHMLILKLTHPNGDVKYVSAAFPSTCGKTNLAMLEPDAARLEGRDRRRRHLLDALRRRRPALRDQPRGRLLRRRPGHRPRDQRQRDRVARRELHLHQRRADRRRRRVVGGPDRARPRTSIDWKGNDWTPASDAAAAHPNARFTAPAGQCPSIAPNWEDPAGVPISAILFGGRRATNVPLVTEALSTGSTACSWARPSPRRRPPRPRAPSASCAATRSRCCRSAATTWPTTGATGSRSARPTDVDKLPKIYQVNWFRKDADGKFIWPGFGENSRVLAWIVDRLEGLAEADETPDRPHAQAGRPRRRRASTSTRPTLAELFAGRPRLVAGRGRPDRGVLHQVRRQGAGRAPTRELEAIKARLSA